MKLKKGLNFLQSRSKTGLFAQGVNDNKADH